MRRYIKRIFAALTVVMLLAANTVPVMAAGETGTLTLSNGQTPITATFKAYRLMDITVGTNENGKIYGYKINSDFAEFFNDKIPTTSIDGNSKDEAAHQYLEENVKTEKFKTDLENFLEKNSINEAGTFTFNNTIKESVEALPYGYYAIMPDVKDGTHKPVFVPLTETTQTTYLKELKPGTDKKVEEGGQQQEWGDASIGDTVNFTVKSIVPNMNGLKTCKFILKDTMSKGLSFDANSVKVKIGNQSLTKDTHFKIESKPSQDSAGGTDITITIEDLKTLGNITANPGDTIVFTYSAVLNKDAVVGIDPVKNAAMIKYTNSPDGGTETTKEDTVIVKTYDLTITKRAENEGGNVLAGAEFKLYKGESAIPDQLVKVVKVDEKGTYRVAEAEEHGTALDTVVTPASGIVTIKGLDKGIYTLEEVKAPDGYNKLNDTIKVTITATSNKDDGTDVIVGGDNNLTVVNKAGTLLPETGGKGTVLFTIIGAIGVAVILLSFVSSKKNKTDAK